MKTEKKATEHVTYDLSAGGVRLCGLPLARVGDEVRVLLQLPRGRGLVRASGRLLRLGETDGRPDFAIQFVHLAARDEDAIHNAVAKALSEPDRRSILLLDERRSGCDWLRPLTPICTAVTTSLEAVEYLRKKTPEIGILGSEDSWPRTSEWDAVYPEVSWRTIDSAGRLQSPCLFRRPEVVHRLRWGLL